MEEDGGGEEPEPAAAFADGQPDEDGKAQLKDQGRCALPQAQQVVSGLGGDEFVDLLTHLRLRLGGCLAEEGIGLAGIDHDRHREGGNHRHAEDEEHLRAPVADAVGNPRQGSRGLLLQEVLHGEEPAGFLKEARHQTAVQRVVPDVSLNGRSVRPLQDHPMHQRLQHQDEYEERRRADEDRGPFDLIFPDHPPGQADGNDEPQHEVQDNHEEGSCGDHGRSIKSFWTKIIIFIETQ